MIWKNLSDEFQWFCKSAKRELIVFAPYVKESSLRSMVSDFAGPNLTVITRWRVADIIAGSSDLSVFQFLNEYGAHLKVLDRLHMKGILRDNADFMLTTANITDNGLGLSSTPNIECAVEILALSDDAKEWFGELRSSAMLVSKEEFGRFEKHIDGLKSEKTPHLLEFVWGRDDCVTHDLTSLPILQCSSPGEFLEGIEKLNQGAAIDYAQREKVIHDSRLLQIRPAFNKLTHESLREKYLAASFTSDFIDFVGNRRYFGEVKAWIQRKYVPHISRRRLTDATRSLFNWTAQLDYRRFKIERPHYSECLVRIRG